jgi:uncharacterized Zn-finger protein
VHLSETCDAQYPHLITCVQTTDATAIDRNQTPLVDAGYVDAGLLVESRESSGVERVGPVSRNTLWQAKAGKGYDLSGFEVDFVAKEATCPQGHASISWSEMRDQHGHPKLYMRFDGKTCRACPFCSQAVKQSPGKLRLACIS